MTSLKAPVLYLSKHLRMLPAACIFILFPILLHAQANVEVFGQNRVQYRKFDFKFFDTRHFRVYFYDRTGIPLARYVCEQAERDVVGVERKLGGQFPKRFNIVVYNSYDEYRQSNIGMKYDAQLGNIPGGVVNVIGDRLVTYFDGVHTDLRRQVREGLMQVVLSRQLLGENVRDVVRNSLLLNFPPWATDGYLAYLVDGWDPKSESEWKNLLSAHPNASFFSIADQYPELAGKAFWKYVSDRYGEANVKSVLYAIQMRSSLNQGIKMALGVPVRTAYDSCLAYYKDVFTKDSLRQETPDVTTALLSIPVPKDNAIVKSMRVSPRGHDVAYVEFKEGEYKIYLQHTAEQQARSLILEEGRKDYNETLPDPDYPILAWSNNGYKLAIMYRHGPQTRLRIYNSLRAKIENYVIPTNKFDRVLGMAFNEDDDKIIFSAVRKSQTDLYAFTIKRYKLTNITDDVWDDIQPAFVSGGFRRGILFLSNRPAPSLHVPAGVNELPTGPMNVYFYDTKTESTTLLQCSYNRKGDNITQPIQYGPDNFAYLLDSNGIQNEYVVTFVRKGNNYDSAVSVPVTNYSRSILEHQYNSAANQVANVLQMDNQYKVFFRPMLIPGKKGVEGKTLQPTTLSQSVGVKAVLPMNGGSQSRQPFGYNNTTNDEPVVKRGNAFQSEFTDTASGGQNFSQPYRSRRNRRRAQENEVQDTDLVLNPFIKDSTYLKLKAQPYRLSFKPDFFSARLDNTVLFTQYQPAAFNGGSPAPQPLSALISISLNDVLENQRFTGGIKLPENLSGMTYFLQYENFTRRVDWSILYLRTATKNTYENIYTDSSGNAYADFDNGKITSNLIQGSVAYPLDRIRRIGLNLGLRQDVLDFKAEDSLSLSLAPRISNYWLQSRAEYVFDNSLSPVTNIRYGFRYKVFAEYMYGLSSSNKGGFYDFGVDFRYYQPIYKHIIFAARLAGAHSDGNQHILYFLGGTDDWIGAKTANIPINNTQNYAFQASETSLRGYDLNARNGNTYAVGNFEVRVPVITTLFQRPIQSSLLRNLQLVPFIDAGDAWNGILPNSVNTSRNYSLNAPGNPVSLQVNVPNIEGLAVGYGAGLRTTLLGYFLRVDAAWNVDGRTKPIWYVSLGTDF